MTACHVVFDLGANEPMINERLVKAGQIPVDPKCRRITGITDQPHMMPRTIETLEVVICPDDSVREAATVDSMVVMSGDTLPHCLLDTETMAKLGIVVGPATWTASYPSRPYERDSPRVTDPLVQPPHTVLAALAHRRHDDDSVAWAGVDVDVTHATPATTCYGISREHLFHGESDRHQHTSYESSLTPHKLGGGGGSKFSWWVSFSLFAY